MAETGGAAGPAPRAGEGGMAGRIRRHDWAATPLGRAGDWPQALRTAVDLMLASPGPVSVIWGPERIQLYNDAYVTVAGDRHPGALGRPVPETWAAAHEALGPLLDRAYAGEAVAIDERTIPFHGPRGEVTERIFTASFSPIRDEAGRVAGVFHPLVELTERVAAERALGAERDRSRAILDSLGEGVALLDAGFRVLDINAEGLRRLGRPREALLGRSCWETLPSSQGTPVEAALRRAMADRVPVELEHRVEDGARDGDVGAWLEIRAYPQGRGLAVFTRDVTARKRGEEVMRATAQALAAEVGALGRLQEVSTRLVADEAPQALYEAILTAAADLMGSECASLQMLDAAGDLRLLAHRGYDARSAEFWRRVDAGSESTCGLAMRTGRRVILPDVEAGGLPEESGDLRAYRWSGMRAVQTTPLLSRSGRPLGMLSTHWARPHTPSERDFRLFDVLARQAADALERAMAQAALRESDARQAFLLALSDALRPLGTPIEIASAAARRLGERFGLSRVFYAELERSVLRVACDYARGVESIAGEHDLEAFGPDLLRAYRDGPVVKVDDVRTDPRFGPEARAGLLARQVGAYLDVVLFEDAQRVGLLALQSATPRAWTAAEEGLAREVGERVKAAIERARTEDRLRELNETLEQRVSDAVAERNTLATLVEAADLMIMVVDLDYNILALNTANADEFERIYGLRPKPGDNMLGLLDGQPEHREQVRAGWSQGMRGEPVTFVEEFGDPGRTRPYYEVNFRPLRNDAGEQVGVYQFVTDATERLRREALLAEAQEALRQSKKMEAMGQLTGGVAHDFNNLLTPIVASLDMLLRRGVGSERERRLMDGALQSAERARVLVQRLLAFARRQPLQPGPVDVRGLVRGMADLIASTSGPRIDVRVDLAEDLPPALADANQLEMALLNLAVNARDAMPDAGVLTISAVRQSVRNPRHPAKLAPGHYVRLSVRDSGTGMDQATLERAVEPFFSTKGVGKGTGLGLSMVHGLASQLGGGLSLDSRPGQGTTVDLWLPISAVAVGAGEPAPRPALPRRSSGTALLVDDEEFVRLSTADMLMEQGYEVVEAASGDEAERLLAEGLVPDLVVTDHLMPGLTGLDLARSLRALRPGLPVLIVSGYAEMDGIAPGFPRLTKPFRAAELAAKLADLIPAPRG